MRVPTIADSKMIHKGTTSDLISGGGPGTFVSISNVVTLVLSVLPKKGSLVILDAIIEENLIEWSVTY